MFFMEKLTNLRPRVFVCCVYYTQSGTLLQSFLGFPDLEMFAYCICNFVEYFSVCVYLIYHNYELQVVYFGIFVTSVML